jgi:putative DNA primase/helicase
VSGKRPPIDFDEVKSAALADIRGVLGRFLPGGKIVRGKYVVLNPTRRDRSLGSFHVNLTSGRWADFATDDRGRDLISLVAYLKSISQYEAAKGLSEMLGVGARR